jgi:hypothetical protein
MFEGRWCVLWVGVAGLAGCIDSPQRVEPSWSKDAGADVGDPFDLGGADKPPLAGSGAVRQAGGSLSASALDGGLSDEGCGPIGEPGRAGSGSQPSAAGAPAAPVRGPGPERYGQVVISEIMADPTTLSDADGEWFELYNTTGGELDLQGCSLDDGGKQPHELPSRLIIGPHAYLTIARQEQPGFKPGYVMSFAFTNSADTVSLRCGGVEIDRVSYDETRDYPLTSGASLSLDPSQLDADDNDRAAAWCAGLNSYGPELGTPGQANPPCQKTGANGAGAAGSRAEPAGGGAQPSEEEDGAEEEPAASDSDEDGQDPEDSDPCACSSAGAAAPDPDDAEDLVPSTE